MGSSNQESKSDRIFQIIETLVRLETLLEEQSKANDKDHTLLKEGIGTALETIKDQDKRLDLLEKEYLKVKLVYDRMKWIWAAIAFIVTPIITSIILFLVKVSLGI